VTKHDFLLHNSLGHESLGRLMVSHITPIAVMTKSNQGCYGEKCVGDCAESGWVGWGQGFG